MLQERTYGRALILLETLGDSGKKQQARHAKQAKQAKSKQSKPSRQSKQTQNQSEGPKVRRCNPEESTQAHMHLVNHPEPRVSA